MKGCPVCRREFREDIALCPHDGETLVETVAAVASDPDTIVRPRQAVPLKSPRFTEVQIGRPNAPEVEVVRTTDVPDRVYQDRPKWPYVLMIALVGVLALGIVGYFVMAQRSDLSSEVGSQVTEARVAVADARARLESLPTESPLRGKLLQLQQWDRELQNLELESDRTRSMGSRAREIQSLARSIGEEARVAGATVPQSPPQVVPAVPGAPPPDATAGTPVVDPMASNGADVPKDETPSPSTQPAGTPPKTEAPSPKDGVPGMKPPEPDPGKPKPPEEQPKTQKPESAAAPTAEGKKPQ